MASASVAAADPPSEHPSPVARPVVSANVGVGGFFDSSLSRLVGAGESWGARLSAGPVDAIRVEVSYSGSLQPVEPTAGDSLIGHGILGLLRINLGPFVDVVEPFMYVGAGWTRYHVRGLDPGSPLAARDDVLAMPFGVGVARRFGQLVVDVRAGVEVSTSGDLLPIERGPDSSRDRARMDRYGVSVTAGYEI